MHSNDFSYSILTILITLALVLIFLFVHYRSHCRREARIQVKRRPDQEKLQDINQALAPFGFAYSLTQDIFYSKQDAWQKDFGYSKLYDEMAPVMNMIIDCEPIYFEYNGKKWLIELWKGQYGIMTGAEVGIYYHMGPAPGDAPESLFYTAASPKEQLPITMSLYKNGKPLFRRGENHWWLTGFVLGEFSYPGELMLHVSLSFEDYGMMEAFIKGCLQAGYRQEDLHVQCGTVSLCLYQPKHSTANGCCRLYREWVQWQNHFNCRIFAHVTKGFDRTIDRLDYLMLAYPGIFRLLTKTGRFAWERKRR
ncbi:MAG: DUF4474 domain-containing protein [Lachnospiraceae bacterium]|jgi:hypothetical protein|nr:DUF4474 domain-containing protein [Lachnospiraceae bacterium]